MTRLFSSTKLLVTALAAGLGLSASAGTHSLYVVENDGLTSFDGLDLSITINDAGTEWDFVVNNNSSSDAVVTGVYFEMDDVAGRDWDWRQYTTGSATISPDATADTLSFDTFDTLVGWSGDSLDDSIVSFGKLYPNSDIQPLWYLDGAIRNDNYRVAMTIMTSEGTATLVTALSGHTASVASNLTDAHAMPTPSAAIAGLGLLGAIAARRRRRNA